MGRYQRYCGEGVAVRLGQRAHCPSCLQQERASQAGPGRNGDRLTEGGGGVEGLPYRGGGGSQAGSTPQRAHCPRILSRNMTLFSGI